MICARKGLLIATIAKDTPMPITYAHPVFTWYLLRGWRHKLVLSGVVAGSLVPDMGKLANIWLVDQFTHSWLGLFLFTLPASLFMLEMWNSFLREGLYRLLPDRLAAGLRDRFPVPSNPAHKGWLMFSILLGGAAHLILDRFSHRWSVIEGVAPWFYTPLFTVFDRWVYSQHLIQIGLSGLGTILLAVLIWKMSRTPPPDMPRATPAERHLFLISGLLMFYLFHPVVFLLSAKYEPTRRMVYTLRHGAVVFAFVFGVLWLLWSCRVKAKTRQIEQASGLPRDNGRHNPEG